MAGSDSDVSDITAGETEHQESDDDDDVELVENVSKEQVFLRDLPYRTDAFAFEALGVNVDSGWNAVRFRGVGTEVASAVGVDAGELVSRFGFDAELPIMGLSLNPRYNCHNGRNRCWLNSVTVALMAHRPSGLFTPIDNDRKVAKIVLSMKRIEKALVTEGKTNEWWTKAWDQLLVRVMRMETQEPHEKKRSILNDAAHDSIYRSAKMYDKAFENVKTFTMRKSYDDEEISKLRSTFSRRGDVIIGMGNSDNILNNFSETLKLSSGWPIGPPIVQTALVFGYGRHFWAYVRLFNRQAADDDDWLSFDGFGGFKGANVQLEQILKTLLKGNIIVLVVYHVL